MPERGGEVEVDMDVPGRAEAKSWVGLTAVGSDGTPVGMCRGVFADTDTGVTEWLELDVPARGRVFVPAVGATEQGDDTVRVDFTGEAVTTAPVLDAGAELSRADERRLYRHYDVPFNDEEAESLLPEGVTEADADQTTSPSTAAPAAPAAPLRPVSADSAPAAKTSAKKAAKSAPVKKAPAAEPPVTPSPTTPPAAAAPVPSPPDADVVRDVDAADGAEAHEPENAPAAVPTAADGDEATGVGVRAAASPLVSIGAMAATVLVVLRWRDARTRRRQRPSARAARLARGARAGVGSVASRGTRGGLGAVAHAAEAVTSPVVAVPEAVAAGGRRVRRRTARTLWDAAKLGAAGGGYVLGARAGHERYVQIAEQAQRVTGRPEVQQLARALTDPSLPGRAGAAVSSKLSGTNEPTGT